MGGAGGGKGPQPLCYKYVFASEKDVMILNICIKSWLRGEWSKIFQATDDERIAIFEAKYFAGLANNTQGAFAENLNLFDYLNLFESPRTLAFPDEWKRVIE